VGQCFNNLINEVVGFFGPLFSKEGWGDFPYNPAREHETEHSITWNKMHPCKTNILEA